MPCLLSLRLLLLLGTIIITDSINSYTPELFVKAKRAMKLSQTAYFEDPRQDDFDYLDFTSSEEERAVVATFGTVCYVAFEGSDLVDVGDIVSNVNLFAETGEVNGCTFSSVHTGALEILRAVSLDDKVSTCMSSCADGAGNPTASCDEMIITGHSKGGAVAMAASAEYESNNPTVVTFGAPPTVLGTCDKIPPERVYHFVNTANVFGGLGGFCFDPIPFIPDFASGGGSHVGDFILVGTDPNNVKVYDNAVEAGDGIGILSFKPCFFNTHIVGYYKDKMDNLDINNDGGSALGLDGFDEGNACGRYDHCNGSGCGTFQTCQDSCDGMNPGAICDGNPNKYCNLRFFSPPVCETKKGFGSFCFKNYECRSDWCLFIFCL